MEFNVSRRMMLGAGSTLAMAGLSACASRKDTAPLEAFPPEKAGDTPLLGPADDVALLSRNENPYGPSPSARKMISYAGTKGAYYGGEAGPKLKAMIAERHGLTPDHVAITTGSGEALSAIALTFGSQGPILAPRLFWDATAIYAERLGLATIQRVPLTPNMEIDLTAIEAAVTPNTGLVQLCNPNNPTGLVYDPESLKASVLRMSKIAPVVVDEAYMELTDDPEGNTCIPLVRDGHNVIVTRTFSKIYGMAGIRVGYALASPEIAAKIQSTAMSWIACTGVAAGVGCYDDHAFVAYSKSKISEARDMVMTTTRELGLETLPSQTNFVYFKSGLPANELQEKLAMQKIMIRGQYMDYTDWSRVSMGKIEDVARFCKALPAAINA